MIRFYKKKSIQKQLKTPCKPEHSCCQLHTKNKVYFIISLSVFVLMSGALMQTSMEKLQDDTNNQVGWENIQSEVFNLEVICLCFPGFISVTQSLIYLQDSIFLCILNFAMYLRDTGSYSILNQSFGPSDHVAIRGDWQQFSGTSGSFMCRCHGLKLVPSG